MGMSKGCGDVFPEVLEISENLGLKVLTSNPLYRDKYLHRERKGGLGLMIFLSWAWPSCWAVTLLHKSVT